MKYKLTIQEKLKDLRVENGLSYATLSSDELDFCIKKAGTLLNLCSLSCCIQLHNVILFVLSMIPVQNTFYYSIDTIYRGSLQAHHTIYSLQKWLFRILH